jgi:hypothetical protein
MVTSQYIGAHQQYVTYCAISSASLTIANIARSMLQDKLTFFGPALLFALDAVAITLFATVVIAVAALAIALFVAHHLVAVSIARVVAVATARPPPSLP